MPNPYSLFLATVERQLYVPMYRGYKVRLWCMFGLLGYTLIVALLFIALTVRDLRKKNNLWIWRVVERPQGRYFIVNQYLYYPFGTAVTSVIWLIYIRYLQQIMVDHIPAQSCFYWIYLHVLPAYCHAYLTTAIVLGSANLIACKSSTRHLLPPWASNGLLMALPVFTLLLVVPAVLAGTAWKRFIDMWEALGADAASKVASVPLLTDAESQAVFGGLMMNYGRSIRPLVDYFDATSHTASICALVDISIVILINIVGAITLVFRLGRSRSSQIVPRDAPVVAPLAPLVLSPMSEKKQIDWDLDNDVPQLPTAQEDEVTKLEKLPWTVTLFYLCTIPFSVVFVLYASWIISPATPFSTPGSATEFAATGMVFVQSFLSALSISMMLIKRLTDARKRPVTPRVAEIPLRSSHLRRGSSDDLDFPHIDPPHEEDVPGSPRGPRTLMQVVSDTSVETV